MSPYRVESQGLMAGIRRNKVVEIGPGPVLDEPRNRERRAALIGILPDRIEAGVIEDFGAERLLYAGSKPALPAFVLRVAALLVAAIAIVTFLF